MDTSETGLKKIIVGWLVKDFDDTYGNIEWKIVTKCSDRLRNCQPVSPQALTSRMLSAMATGR